MKKMKKAISLILTIALVLTVCAPGAYADGTESEPKTTASTGREYDGDGTESYPIKIDTAQKLYDIRYIASFGTKNYILTDKINLNDLWNDATFMSAHSTELSLGTFNVATNTTVGAINWVPIPNFAGTLDGKDCTISNLTINAGAKSDNALFAKTSGTPIFRNIILSNVKIESSKDRNAALVSRSQGGITIENCHLKGTADNHSKITGWKNVGGIIGEIQNQKDEPVKISGCSVEYTDILASKSAADMSGFGGIIGSYKYQSVPYKGKIDNCKVKGVKIAGNCIGGIIGYASYVNIDNCSVENVQLTAYLVDPTLAAKENDLSHSAGGLIGQLFQPGVEEIAVTNSYVKNTEIKGIQNIGGLIGVAQYGSSYIDIAVGVKANYIDNVFKVRECGAEDITISGINGVFSEENPNRSPVENSTLNKCIGGFIGLNLGAEISDSYIHSGNIRALRQVGGFVGKNSSRTAPTFASTGTINLGQIINCNAQDVTISTPDYTGVTIPPGVTIKGYDVGGFVGSNAGGNLSYNNTKNLQVTKDSNVTEFYNIGGFVGLQSMGKQMETDPPIFIGNINNCNVNSIDIKAEDCGQNVGGFIGKNQAGDIFKVFSVNGEVAGKDNIGSFIGLNGDGTTKAAIEDSYTTVKKIATITAGAFTGGGTGSYANSYYFEKIEGDTITVLDHTGKVENVTLGITSSAIKLKIDESVSLELTKTPADATYNPLIVKWNVNENGQVTSSSSTGAAIKALKAGTITVTANIDGIEKSIEITAEQAPNPSSGGSGGGGGTTPSNTTPTTSTSGGKTTVSTTANVNTSVSGKTTATVTEAQVKETIDKAVTEAKKQGTDSVVEIKVTAPKTTTTVETTVQGKSISNLTDSKIAALMVTTPLSNLTFDETAIGKIKDQISGDVKMAISTIDNQSLSSEAKAVVGDRTVLDISIISNNQKVTDFGKGKLKISIPYTLKSGEKAENVVAYYINSAGKPEKMVDAKYNPETKEIVFTTNHLSVYAVGYEEKIASKFSDVEANAWYANYVYTLVNKGVIKGKTETIFAPKDTITRAEFVTMLANMAGAKQTSGKAIFKDVAETAWYKDAATWAAEAGIAKGFNDKGGDLIFNPNGKITRQDMAVMIQRYADSVAKYKITGSNSAMAFSDDVQIASYAKDAVLKMQQAGIIAGRDDGKFAPLDYANRGEAAKMIAIFIQQTGN